MYSSFGMNWQSPTWKKFHERVVVELDVNKHVYQLPATTDESIQQLIGYFENVVGKVDALKEKAQAGTQKYRIRRDVTTEAFAAKGCIDMLVRLPHTVLENTGRCVYDFSAREKSIYYPQDAVATELKNMLSSEWADQSVFLGRVPTALDFPACGVNFEECHCTHNEQENSFRAIKSGDKVSFDSVLKYDYLPVLPADSTHELPLLNHALPKDRNSPFNVAFVLALENVEKSLRDTPDERFADRGVVDKLAHYLKSFLEVTPGREVIFGAVTNLQECVFVAVHAQEPNKYVPERTYERYHSTVLGRDVVARELASFCASTPRNVGLNPALYHSPHLALEACLHRGRRGAVLRACWQSDPIVLKVSVHKNALDVERALLLYLEDREVTNVPRIHKQAQKDLFPCFDQSCTAFETLLVRSETTLSEAQLLQLWDILRSLHREGIVHRDVRAANMMRDEAGNMYLTSFRAAQFYNTPSFDARVQLQTSEGVSLDELKGLYDPTNANTASTAVLWHGLPTLPADEACALIYTALQVNFPDSNVNVNQLPPGAVTDRTGTFLRIRCEWPLELCEKKDVPADGIRPDIDTVVTCLADLRKRRADDTYTAEDIRATVHSAVKAVYRLKRSVDAALLAAAAAEKARGMRTRAATAAAVTTFSLHKTNEFDFEAYAEQLMKAELTPRERDAEADRREAELAALLKLHNQREMEIYARGAKEKRAATSANPSVNSAGSNQSGLNSNCETKILKPNAVASQCEADPSEEPNKRARLD